MPPAFSTTRQAVAFSLLLAIVISMPAVLPVVVAKTGWFRATGKDTLFESGRTPRSRYLQRRTRWTLLL